MKKTTGILLVLVALLSAFGWSGYAQKRPPKTAWEYKALRNQDLSDQTLNDLGAQGWELVSVAAYGNPGTGSSQTAYLKRAK